MSVPCASCGAAMAASDPVCPSCGQAKAAPRARAATSDDALQYVKIIGILVVVVAVVLMVASLMGPGAQPCGDCGGRKFTICDNCADGVNKCRPCSGSGLDPGTFSTCLKCSGKGSTPSCLKCGGNPKKNCRTCKGTGLKPE
ncbi:MAG TPA: hypothetical protein VFC90_10010 [Planctomycetota bacterium]|nr:hypothetical protein [Planctomycetota bacterium]